MGVEKEFRGLTRREKGRTVLSRTGFLVKIPEESDEDVESFKNLESSLKFQRVLKARNFESSK